MNVKHKAETRSWVVEMWEMTGETGMSKVLTHPHGERLRNRARCELRRQQSDLQRGPKTTGDCSCEARRTKNNNNNNKKMGQ
jgi:hypothetical protein